MLRSSIVMKLVLMVMLAVTILSSPAFVSASPQAPGHVPEQVGNFDELRKLCNSAPMPSWLLDLISFFTVSHCYNAADRIDHIFSQAYLRAEGEIASPGYPINDVHFWRATMIQDFSGGTWSKGALIMRWQPPEQGEYLPPFYVGGCDWSIFERATNNYGVFPGYPINHVHQWNKVWLQDFREGSWGDGAIIGGCHGELVAGNHWKAYIKADGSNLLGRPISFVSEETVNSKTWWVQYFEWGKIQEANGFIWVVYNNGQQRMFNV